MEANLNGASGFTIFLSGRKGRKHHKSGSVSTYHTTNAVALVMELACNQDTLCLRPLEPEIESGCLLVWKKNLTFSTAMQRFIEYVKEHLTGTKEEDTEE